MAADLAEFESTLKKQGGKLYFTLGRSLDVALRRFGFQEDQKVSVLFAPDRLIIRPRGMPDAIREKLLLAAKDLQEIRDRMEELRRQLPPVLDEDLEAEESAEGELLGLLECLIADDLDPALQKMRSVSSVSPRPATARKGRARSRSGKQPGTKGPI
jgi:hypothetical protein